MSRSVHSLFVGATSAVYTTIVFLTTNTIDSTRFAWDNTYYRAMAETWLAPHSLNSPFAYRPGGPVLARLLSDMTGMSLEQSFGVLAWLGCTLQLVVVWHFVCLISHSERAAWVGWAVAAASFWNIKFLAFYLYSTDNLAYPLVFGSLVAAISRRWFLCVFLALLGLLFREFAVIPPLAAVASMASLRDWAQLKRSGGALVGLTLISLVAPRVLIVVSSSSASVSMSRPLQDVMGLALSWQRDLNLILAVVYVALPVICLWTTQSTHVPNPCSQWASHMLRWYAVGVLSLAMIGGSDLGRFISYVIPVVALLAGRLSESASVASLVAVVAVTAWFNRIGEPIPAVSIDEYLDHYGVFHNRINAATLTRVAWLLGCLALGRVATKLLPRRSAQ